MKNLYPKVSLGKFCRLFGITRQAYYQYFWHREQLSFEDGLIVSEVLKIRERHRHMGTRKLYELLQPFLLERQIKMGRDRLFDILAAHNLLVRRRKRQTITQTLYIDSENTQILLKILHLQTLINYG